MKKLIKIVTVSLMMLVVMTGLTGCRRFEEMRQSQGILKNEKVLIFQDDEYYLLPEYEYLNPTYSSEGLVYPVPEGAPVLLSRFFADTLRISKDGDFLMGRIGHNIQTFCHEDRYDEVMEIIENGYEPNGYRVEYYNFEKDCMEEYILSDEELKAVDLVLGTTPVEITDDDMLGYTLAVDSCVKGTPFSKYEFDLMQADEGYYFERYDDNGRGVYYKVPAELNPVFEKLIDISF